MWPASRLAYVLHAMLLVCWLLSLHPVGLPHNHWVSAWYSSGNSKTQLLWLA